MKNKMIKDIVKIIDKLDPEDAKTMLDYVSGSECAIKNLSDDLLHYMESGNIKSEADQQKYKDVQEDHNIAKVNYELLDQYIAEKNKKDSEK